MAQSRGHFLTIAGAVALFAATLALLIATEPVTARLGFSIAVTAAIAAGIALLSRHLLFASLVTFSIVALVVAISYEKMVLMNMALHSYDIPFYLNAETLSFLWEDYRIYVASALAALVGIGVLAALAWRFDENRCGRVVVACALAMAVFAAIKLEPKETVNSSGYRMFGDTQSLVSSFYLSWGETVRALQRGQLLKAARATTLPALRAMTQCTPPVKPPHILLIHEESLVPPSLFPTLNYDRSLDSFFLSDDQRLHKLGVETYGGASWITEFALLSGVATRDFGGMRPFVQVFMRNRLSEPLPETLRLCGYRTVMLFPMPMAFVSLGTFYKSVGFSEVLDQRAQGAAKGYQRDRFYFDNALKVMERHFKSSDQPLFLEVKTMLEHGPHDRTLMPEEQVPGGGTSFEMNEYLRRMAMVRADGDYFMQEINRRFPGEPILIVRYGDHHPIATRRLLAQARADVKRGATKGAAPDPYVTFYAMDGHNFVVPPLPDYDVLNVAYLGTIMLEAAGLPLSEAQQERKRLMVDCEGRYADCEKALIFNRRLINSGLLQLP